MDHRDDTDAKTSLNKTAKVDFSTEKVLAVSKDYYKGVTFIENIAPTAAHSLSNSTLSAGN